MPDEAATPSLTRPLSEIKAELFRALAHPARIRVLEVLADGERSVGEMAAAGGHRVVPPVPAARACCGGPAWSRTRKEGSSVFYDVGDPAVVELLAAAKRVLINPLADTEELLVGLRTEGRST